MFVMVPDIEEPYSTYMGTIQPYSGDMGTIQPYSDVCTCLLINTTSKYATTRPRKMRRSLLHFAKRLWSSEDSRRMICEGCKNDPITRKTLCKKCIRKSTVCNTCYNQLMKSNELTRRSSEKWSSSMVHSFTEPDIPHATPEPSNTEKLLKLSTVKTCEQDESPTSADTYHTPICKSMSFDFSFSGGIGNNKHSSSSEEYVSCSDEPKCPVVSCSNEPKIDNRTQALCRRSVNHSYESISSLDVSNEERSPSVSNEERSPRGLSRTGPVLAQRPSITRTAAVEIEDVSVVKVKHASMDDCEILLPHLTDISIKKLAVLQEDKKQQHLSLLCEEVLPEEEKEKEEEEEEEVKRSVRIAEQENQEYSRPCSLQSLELQHPTVEETPAYYIQDLQSVVSVSMQKSESQLKRSLSVASTTRLQRKLSKRLAPIPVQKQTSPDRPDRSFLRKKYDSESSHPDTDTSINLSKSGMRECDVKMFGSLYMERLEQEIRAIAVLKEIENKNNITFRDRLKGALDQHEQLAADLESVRKELRECMESYRCLSETFV